MIQITEEKLREAIQTGLGQDGLYTKLLTDGLIKEIKALAISRVVGRSEQLKAFGKSLQYKGVRILTDEGVEQAVKDFESL